MTKSKLDRLIRYVNERMDIVDPKYPNARPSNNISISLGPLSEKDFSYLRKHFKTVEQQGFFGYVKFTREIPMLKQSAHEGGSGK